MCFNDVRLEQRSLKLSRSEGVKRKSLLVLYASRLV
jgi:hypothetical protein